MRNAQHNNAVLTLLNFKPNFFEKQIFDVDNKRYGAMLVYHFSTSSNIYAQNDIRDTVPKIRDLLERKGYKTYEEGMNGSAGNSKFSFFIGNVKKRKICGSATDKLSPKKRIQVVLLGPGERW